MARYDPLAREDGKCAYIGDGRESPCGLAEGWGYDKATSGFCSHHGKRGGQEGNPGGAPPEGNQNGSTHGMYSDANNYYKNLDEAGQQFVDFHYWGFVNDAPFDDADPKSGVLFEIAVNHHKRLSSDGTIATEGMSETKPVPAGDMALSDTKEHHLHLTYDRYARTDIRRLKELDVLDSPDSRQADALDGGVELTLSTDDKDALEAAFDTES